MHKRKSAGYDMMTPDMLKNLEHGIEILTEIFNRVWNEGRTPLDWKTRVFQL